MARKGGLKKEGRKGKSKEGKEGGKGGKRRGREAGREGGRKRGSKAARIGRKARRKARRAALPPSLPLSPWTRPHTFHTPHTCLQVIEMVLSTDMKQHFTQLSLFKTKFSTPIGKQQ